MNIKVDGKVREIEWHKGMKFSEIVQPLIAENVSEGKLLYSIKINTKKGPVVVKPEHIQKLNDASVEGNEDIEFYFKNKKDYIIELSDQVLPYIDKIQNEISSIVQAISNDPNDSKAMKDLGNIIDGIGALGQTIVPIISLRILKLDDFVFEGKKGEGAFDSIKNFVDSFKIKIESDNPDDKVNAISEMLPKLLAFYKSIFQNVRN